MIANDKLAQVLRFFGLEPNNTIIDRLVMFTDFLLERNSVMNLTAITDEDGIITKHIADSLSVLNCRIETDSSLIDVGTGAGFPGIVLAIVRPDLRVCLMDSLQKRVLFLREAADRLGLDAVVIHARAEELGHDEKYRERYDIAVSRAVAVLPALCEYCIPFVKPGGRFLAMKGNDFLSELNDAKPAIETLGASLIDQIPVVLPQSDAAHNILVMEKVRQTPPKYPRKQACIAKKPIIQQTSRRTLE